MISRARSRGAKLPNGKLLYPQDEPGLVSLIFFVLKVLVVGAVLYWWFK